MIKGSLKKTLEIREILPGEYQALGQLMVAVYSGLEGFPTPTEQPAYYEMLANIGKFNEQADTKVLVAVSANGAILGGLVYFSDMARYGAGGIAGLEKNASGFRLLGVVSRVPRNGRRKSPEPGLH